jgi:hypothetical protein
MVRVVWCVPCLQPLISPWWQLTWGHLWKISADRNVKWVISSACHDFLHTSHMLVFGWLDGMDLLLVSRLSLCVLFGATAFDTFHFMFEEHIVILRFPVWKKVNNIVLRVFLSKRYEIQTIIEFFWVGACCPRSDIICQCCSRNYLQLFEQKYLNRFLNKTFYYKMNASLLGSDLWGNLFCQL